MVPRSWLKKICDDEGQVRIFSKLPVNPFKSHSEDTPYFPTLEHFNNTFVGSFTCEEHERMFSSTDNPEPDLCDSTNLSLMVYKPIIATLWQQELLLRSVQSALAELPESELLQSMVQLQQQRVIGLKYYKQQTEQCLDPQECQVCKGGKCKAIAHRIFHLPGEPAIAASDFSDGRTRVNPLFGVTQYIANWGITVLPSNKGHEVILHHFVEEERIIEPMSQTLSGLQGKKLQRIISYQLLKSFENIAISPQRWEQFGENRRRAIVGLFTNEVPDIGFGSIDTVMKWERDRLRPEMAIPNPNLINLFNPSKR